MIGKKHRGAPKGSSRQNANLEEKLRVLDFWKGEGKGWKQPAVVEHFKNEIPSICQSTLSRWKTAEARLRKLAEDPKQLSTKKTVQVEYPELERALAAWLLHAEGRKI